MENFDYAIVEEAAKQLYIKALCDLPPDVREALKKAYARETQPAARSIFEAMFKAIEIADTKKTLLCHLDQFLIIFRYFADGMSSCSIRMISAVDHTCVQAHDISFPKNDIFFGNPMHHFIIKGYTDGGRISFIIQERGNASKLADPFFSFSVNLQRGDARFNDFTQSVVNFCQNLSGFTHKPYLFF